MTKDARISLRIQGELVRQVEDEASRHGLVLPSGKANVSAMVALIIREWLKSKQHRSG